MTEPMRVRTVLELGGAVHDRRVELGLTQAQLAERANVTREWVVRLEGGKPRVQMDRVFDLLRALDVEVVLHAKGH
ncbi:helix-turn-helix domain-containing protein [Agromyces humatus]|uniref:HTH cro/C1-type domain-containing protein n=1 Tax=Agromyces humatus TaxID=279573 RepID=A0ABN2KXC6_9MICO|nr:helix-turn-helix domain-containing protein [Agromyces humatus]